MAAMSISSVMGGKRNMPQPNAGKTADGGHYEIHPHSDGTAHSVSPDGESKQHPSVHHALAHIAGHHEPDGAHSIVHHHEAGHTSHHAKGGKVEGPVEHQDLEGVKEKMAEVSGEDGEGWGGKDQYDHPPDGENEKLFG